MRLSFQSIDAPELPALHAQLVEVGTEQSRTMLSTPSIVLRYLLEDFVNHLLTTTKFLFLPSLEFRWGGRPVSFDGVIEHASRVIVEPVRFDTPRERAALRAKLLARATSELAAHAVQEVRLLADYDAADACSARCLDELRETGLSDADARFLIDARVTPDFYDDFMRRGRSVQDLVVAMHEAHAARQVFANAGGDLVDVMRAARGREFDSEPA